MKSQSGIRTLFAIGAIAASAAANAGIVSTSGLTIISPPAVVEGSYLVSDGLPTQVIFDERQDVVLTAPLMTDTGTIAAGTRVDSEFFSVNSNTATTADTSATFTGAVLGVIYMDTSLTTLGAASDFLGAPGTTYLWANGSCSLCGFEAGQDSLTVSGNTVNFHNFYDNPGDFARIIVAGVPEPSTWAMLTLGFAGLGFLGYRKTKAGVSASAAA